MYPRRGKAKKYLFGAAVSLILAAIFLLLLDARIRPIIRSLSSVQAQNYAAVALNTAINAALRENGVSYESLVNISTDENGSIVAIRSNSLMQNLIKTDISARAARLLGKVGFNCVEIPIGSLTGLSLLNGRGPRLKLNINLLGSATVDFSTAFEDAGVNQTRHMVYLSAGVNVGVFYPTETIYSGYSTDICIAETVIVGKVPLAYGNFEMPGEITQK